MKTNEILIVDLYSALQKSLPGDQFFDVPQLSTVMYDKKFQPVDVKICNILTPVMMVSIEGEDFVKTSKDFERHFFESLNKYPFVFGFETRIRDVKIGLWVRNNTDISTFQQCDLDFLLAANCRHYVDAALNRLT